MDRHSVEANEEPNEEVTHRTAERESLVAYLLGGPDLCDLDLERDQSPMREVDW
jgi:hypothetical protein